VRLAFEYQEKTIVVAAGRLAVEMEVPAAGFVVFE